MTTPGVPDDVRVVVFGKPDVVLRIWFAAGKSHAAKAWLEAEGGGPRVSPVVYLDDPAATWDVMRQFGAKRYRKGEPVPDRVTDLRTEAEGQVRQALEAGRRMPPLPPRGGVGERARRGS